MAQKKMYTHIGMRTVAALNQGNLYNETGSAEICLWEGWIDFIKGQQGMLFFLEVTG